MKHLVVIALFLNAFLVAGRLIQEANAEGDVPAPSRNGDVNCDGILDLSDAVGILQFLFIGGPEPCAFAADATLEDRVTALEQTLSSLRDSNRVHRAEIGALLVADVGLSGLRVETDITARLSEIHAVATAGTDVTVEPSAAHDFLDASIASLKAVAPVAPLDPNTLHRPRAVASETDAALNALNRLVDAADQAVVDTQDGYPRLFATIALAQSRGTPVNVEDYLDAMVAENLEDLRAVVTGEEFRAAKEEIDALVAAWEETLPSGGDDAQLAMMDLQDMLQKMQQVIQMLSHVCKTLHDTSMAIIRKIV